MILGKVTNKEVRTDRDSENKVLMLQVELTDERDIQDVELFKSAGEDATPHDGAFVIVLSLSEAFKVAVGVEDGIEPETKAGEKEIYSYDEYGGSKLARVLCNEDGEVIHNEGERLVARKEDEITITAETDPEFFVFMNGLAALLGKDPILSVTGKINDGTDEVKVP